MVEFITRTLSPILRRWECQKCGQSNPEGMINCPKCGAWK